MKWLPQKPEMPLFSMAKGQWASLVGVTSHSGQGRSPSFSVESQPQRSQGSVCQGSTEGSEIQWLLSTWMCLDIQRVWGEGGLCSLPVLAPLPSAQFPAAQQGTALLSLLWPCGHSIAQHSKTYCEILWQHLKPPRSGCSAQSKSEQVNQSWGDPAHPKAVTWAMQRETCREQESHFTGTDTARAAQGSWGKQKKCLEEIEHPIFPCIAQRPSSMALPHKHLE